MRIEDISYFVPNCLKTNAMDFGQFIFKQIFTCTQNMDIDSAHKLYTMQNECHIASQNCSYGNVCVNLNETVAF